MKFSYLSILFFVLMVSSAYAVQVDETTTLATLNDTFNYTFPYAMNFSIVGVYSDRVMLNNTNISIIPNASTGYAIIYNVLPSRINFKVCGTNKNVNMSFQGLESGMDVYIVEDTKWYSNVGTTNITFNATTGCKTILLRQLGIVVTSVSAVYPNSITETESVNPITKIILLLIPVIAALGVLGYVVGKYTGYL